MILSVIATYVCVVIFGSSAVANNPFSRIRLLKLGFFPIFSFHLNSFLNETLIDVKCFTTWLFDLGKCYCLLVVVLLPALSHLYLQLDELGSARRKS